MSKILPWALLCLAIGAIFAVREAFPKKQTEVLVLPGKTDTVRVEQLDTVEVIRWRMRVDTVTLTRTLYVADTVRIPCDSVSLTGVTSLSAPMGVGDSLIVRGFSVEGDSAGVSKQDWRASIFTLGPLSTLIADTVPPRVGFHDPPKLDERSWLGRIWEAADFWVGLGGGVLGCGMVQ